MVDRIEGNFQEQEIRFQDDVTITIQGRVSRKKLDASFNPKEDPWAVICGRGKDSFNHTGNKRLRVLVQANLEKYASTKSKIAKTLIVSSIVDAVRNASPKGGFVKQCPKTKQWEEVGCDVAREKIGQLFREFMTRKDPTKLRKRKEQRKTKGHKTSKGGDRSCASSSSRSDSSVSTVETCAVASLSTNVTATESDSLRNDSLSSLDNGLGCMDLDPLPLDVEDPGLAFSYEDICF